LCLGDALDVDHYGPVNQVYTALEASIEFTLATTTGKYLSFDDELVLAYKESLVNPLRMEARVL
jgi:hypothetical protein